MQDQAQDENASPTPDIQTESPYNQEYNPEIEAPTQSDMAPLPEQPQAMSVQPVAQQPVPAPTLQPQPQQDSATPILAPQPSLAVPPVVLGNQPKPKRKWLIPAVALGVVVLTGGGASAYYFGYYQQPGNVLLDAFNKITTAKALQSDTTITFNKDFSNDMTLKDVKFKTSTNTSVAGMIDMVVDIEYKGKAMPIGAKGIVLLADSTLYFQINNVKQAIETIIDATGVSSDVPSGYFDGLEKLQDQWVKVGISDLKQSNQAAGSDFECAVSVIKKHTNSANQELVDVYKKSPFVTVKENLGVKDGRIGYKLGWDSGKEKEFRDKFKDTQIYKDMKACNTGDTSSDTPSTVDTAASDGTVYNVWVDQWTHELKKIEISGESGKGKSAMTFSGVIDFAYDPKVKVEAPSNSITLDEYKQRYNEAAKKMGAPDSSMLEDQYSSPLDDSYSL